MHLPNPLMAALDRCATDEKEICSTNLDAILYSILSFKVVGAKGL
jgi:hypothetical protein